MLVGAAASGALVFGWALADGRRPEAVPRPVRLWAAATLAAALTATALVLGFWFVLAAAMGGSTSRVDAVPVAGYGVLAVAVTAACGTTVAAAGVRIGRR